MRHNQDGSTALPFDPAPEATGEAAGGKQFVPVRERRAAAEKDCAYQQVVFFNGEESGFLRILVKDACAELLHGMQDGGRLSV